MCIHPHIIASSIVKTDREVKGSEAVTATQVNNDAKKSDIANFRGCAVILWRRKRWLFMIG